MADAVAREPEFGRVGLAQYVAVQAAAGRGVPLGDALAHEKIPEDVWMQADEAWGEALLQSADTDMALIDEYDAALAAAKARLVRRIHPLDEDLGAWVAFFRCWSTSADPTQVLADARLTTADVMALSQTWTQKIAADRELGSEFQRRMMADPEPVPAVTADPVQLPPPVRPVPIPSLPDPDDDEPEPIEPAKKPPPNLLNPLPAPPRPASAGPAPVASPWPVMPAPPPVPTAPPPAPEEPPKLSIGDYASAMAELEVFPGQADRVAAKYGVGTADLDADRARWSRRLDASADLRKEYQERLGYYRSHWTSVAQWARR